MLLRRLARPGAWSLLAHAILLGALAWQNGPRAPRTLAPMEVDIRGVPATPPPAPADAALAVQSPLPTMGRTVRAETQATRERTIAGRTHAARRLVTIDAPLVAAQAPVAGASATLWQESQWHVEAAGDGSFGPSLKTWPTPLDAPVHTRLPYTRAAMNAGVAGAVHISLVVDVRGRVARAQVRQGLGYGLDEIALRLISKFRFRPAADHYGRPVAAEIQWRFDFHRDVRAAAASQPLEGI